MASSTLAYDGVTIGVAQFAPTSDRGANLAMIKALATSAVARGARLVVFPEYSSYFVNPVGESFLGAAEDLDGPFVGALAALADELETHLVAGMSERVPPGHGFSNTLVAVAPRRGRVAVYRKQHLYDAFGIRESEWVVPGEVTAPELFRVDGVAFGLQTCYDLRFPEITRTIVDAGADVVLVPSEWVRGPLKENHWRTLIAARAIENTVYLAAADQVPPVGVGCSVIVDPMGLTVADAGEVAGVAAAPVSPERIRQVRELNPALALRRYRVEPR